MEKKRGALAVLAATAGWMAAASAFAAGGHHAVDDANTLPAGRCEQEDWFSREHRGERMLHAGFNCGVGPVELGVAAEHARDGGASATAWNLEAKWARKVVEGLNVGFDVQPVWQAHQRHRYAATRFAALASWSPQAPWCLHLNLGHDYVRAGRDFAHWGVGVDWEPAERWTFTGEAFAEQGTRFVRAGARWAAGEHVTIDFSRAQRIGGAGPSNFTLGVTFGFD